MFRFRLTASRSGIRGSRRRSAGRKRAFPSRPAPAPRSRPRATVGWFMPGRSDQLRPSLDPQCRRRISCGARRDGSDISRSRPVRADRGARCGDGERLPDRRDPRRQVPANRCYTSSSARTGLPSIPAHGGQQAKAKRFADDAQDISDSSRRGGGRGPDVAGDTAAADPLASAPAPRRRPPTPIGSSICSATCSSACAPTTSRSRTTPS